MRRLIASTVLALGAVLVFAAPSSAHRASEQGFLSCFAAIDRQIEMGVAAGGGPKAGEPGPINCDHFYFYAGLIGHDHSGGP
jgi:hypothetical protein